LFGDGDLVISWRWCSVVSILSC